MASSNYDIYRGMLSQKFNMYFIPLLIMV